LQNYDLLSKNYKTVIVYSINSLLDHVVVVVVVVVVMVVVVVAAVVVVTPYRMCPFIMHSRTLYTVFLFPYN